MSFTVDNLQKAICLFYQTEAAQQVEAHQWLTEAQNSPTAWSFVWELLHPQRPSEVQFFGATTLHIKLVKAWTEIPVDHYENLKKHILESIISFATGPKIVLNRLCIALATFIIQTIPDQWPNAFEELVSSFQPQYLPNVEPERVVWILLEILSVIPEEFETITLAMSHRQRVKAVLMEVSKDILKVVEMCIAPIPEASPNTSCSFLMSNLTTYLHSSRCATAWIQIGGLTIDDCSKIMTLLVDLACFVYWNRTDHDCLLGEEVELFEVSLDALTAVVQHPSTFNYPAHVMKHTAYILMMFTKILDAEKRNPEPNKDVLTSIYLLIESIGDSHCKIFINGLKSKNEMDRQISNDVINCILGCSGLPGAYPVDETSSTATFGFWYTLQDEITALETAECAELLLIVKPYYRQLTCIMLRKSMYPSKDDSCGWSLDDHELFRCYRQDISDTFMYCYNVLNIEMLDILLLQLQEALASCTANPDHWTSVESCLHAFSSVAECIELENLFLPKLMDLLPDIPYKDLHWKVWASCLDCIGAYSEWIADHPNVLNNVVPLVTAGITHTKVSANATMALKDLTLNCQKFLVPFAEHILAACQNGLIAGNLKLSECIRIMYSIGKMLSVLPVTSIMQYLNVILAPSFDELRELLSREPNETNAMQVTTNLKMLSSLYGSLHVKMSPEEAESHKQPLLIIVQNTMPLYLLVGSKYNHNDSVMEVLSLVLKHTLTTLMDDSRPIINDILELVVQVYRQNPQTSILVVAKTAAILFGKEAQYIPTMQHLLTEIINTTLRLIAQLNSIDSLSQKTDLIEGFFNMLAQIYKKVPHLMNHASVDSPGLFQCATICLQVAELSTIKASTAYLVNFITHSRETEQAATVQNYGEALVARVLISLGSAPRASADVLSEILLALNKKYCDNLSRWLHAMLQQEGFPSTRPSMKQKEKFVKSVLREKANKRKLSEAVVEFTLVCRGILNTC